MLPRHRLQDLGGGRKKTVAFCSRIVTPAEQLYSPIQKECLASGWACEKFDRFLCGLAGFKLLTDHTLVVPLINVKDFDKTALSCQRLLIRLIRCKAKAEYATGKDFVDDDTLSRSPIQINPRRSPSCIPPRWTMLFFIHTLTGWPNYEEDVPECLKAFIIVRSLLSVSNGLLAYTDLISIPTLLRPDVLKTIHTGHQ